MMYNKITYREK